MSIFVPLKNKKLGLRDAKSRVRNMISYDNISYNIVLATVFTGQFKVQILWNGQSAAYIINLSGYI